jgi:hypothetical protein
MSLQEPEMDARGTEHILHAGEDMPGRFPAEHGQILPDILRGEEIHFQIADQIFHTDNQPPKSNFQINFNDQ